MWGYHFKIPTSIADKYIEGKDRRILCTINGEETIHCALMPSPEGFFILINKSLKKRLKLAEGKPAELNIEKDRSKYGMPVAEEFQAILKEDEVAARYFEKLSPGRQRNLLHLVNKIKSPDIRIRRCLAIFDHLVENKGEIDFKGLNEKIKAYNQRLKIERPS